MQILIQWIGFNLFNQFNFWLKHSLHFNGLTVDFQSAFWWEEKKTTKFGLIAKNSAAAHTRFIGIKGSDCKIYPNIFGMAPICTFGRCPRMIWSFRKCKSHTRMCSDGRLNFWYFCISSIHILRSGRFLRGRLQHDNNSIESTDINQMNEIFANNTLTQTLMSLYSMCRRNLYTI